MDFVCADITIYGRIFADPSANLWRDGSLGRDSGSGISDAVLEPVAAQEVFLEAGRAELYQDCESMKCEAIRVSKGQKT